MRPAESRGNRIYGDLADWYHLLTHPSGYAVEAAYYAEVIRSVAPATKTLLELGCGGGANASYLKRQFLCTLTDVSPRMLEVSASINPECEHLQGDMRTLRLGRTFDAVFVHDAIEYMHTEADLAVVAQTIAAHLVPGGVALVTPDAVAETFAPGTDCGGHDGSDGRSLRYVEWTTDPDPADTTFEVDFALLLRDADGLVWVEHDHHTFGLFPRVTWERAFRAAGLEEVSPGVPDPYEGQHVVFVVKKPA